MSETIVLQPAHSHPPASPRPTLESGYQASIERLEPSEWHSLVSSFDDLSIHQTFSYARARWPRSTIEHLILRRDGEVVAAAQARLISLPPLGGIAFYRSAPLWRHRQHERDLEILRQMARAIATEYVRRRGYLVFLIPHETEDSADVGEVLRGEGFIERPSDYNTVIMDLGEPLEVLRTRFEPRWRTELNRSMRSSLFLTEGTELELFDRFAPIYSEMFERKALTDLGDLDVYRRAQALLPEPLRMRVMLASDEAGNDVAGAITSSLGDMGLGILWATNLRGRELRAAYFLQWHVLGWLVRQGCTSYDLGGVDKTRNPGGFRFKSGLAGKNGRELRSLGSFEMSPWPFMPALLHMAKSSRLVLQRWLKASSRLLTRSK